MKRILPFLFLLMLSSCSQTIYIVRHAEKAIPEPGASQMMISDPPLSEPGHQRALQLKAELEKENIRTIFSTNYMRTVSTARPLSESGRSTRIEMYAARIDSMDAFIAKLKSIRKGNILVVGHSNTVDDLANKICGSTVVAGDLKDTQYDNLFVIRRKGSRYHFTGKKYGAKTE